MRGVGGGSGVGAARLSEPDHTASNCVDRPQRMPLSCNARRLVRSQVLADAGTSDSQIFSSAIYDVRYRLTWGFLIEAIETGERALIPYRWEQIGRKHATSSRMQRRSADSVTIGLVNRVVVIRWGSLTDSVTLPANAR